MQLQMKAGDENKKQFPKPKRSSDRIDDFCVSFKPLILCNVRLEFFNYCPRDNGSLWFS